MAPGDELRKVTRTMQAKGAHFALVGEVARDSRTSDESVFIVALEEHPGGARRRGPDAAASRPGRRHVSPRRLYRTAATAEAVAWTLLIFGMLAKYVLHAGDLPVRLGGGIHGFVFLSYCVSTVVVWTDHRWPAGTGVSAWCSRPSRSPPSRSSGTWSAGCALGLLAWPPRHPAGARRRRPTGRCRSLARAGRAPGNRTTQGHRGRRHRERGRA
ncbi:DUF3817 domain-containing protein [Kocuria rhizophila]|nr:DUF3817 domain-containing protein [Kocuria rhizophila]